MQNSSNENPLQSALRDQELNPPPAGGISSSPNLLPPPRVKVSDTTKIKIPMSGVEKVVDLVEGEGEASGKKSFVTIPEWEKSENSYPVVQKEKPAHRIIAYMAASGATTQRIADETGYGIQQVRILLNQTWMKAHISQLIHENFNDDISGILKAGAVDAIMTIRTLSTESPNEKIRLSAAQDLLDRYRGKATQFIHTSSSEVPADPSEEIGRLEAELKDVIAEERLLK